MTKRIRRIGSVKQELLKKSREAILAAVQIFNNPNITFKSESFIVLMVIAWTYLLHAYFHKMKIEYRHFEKKGKKRVFSKTKQKAHKFWGLETCLTNTKSPIDKNTKNNLIFLIGLRHEIEHRMTSRIDDVLYPKIQACCLNYNEYIKELFGQEYNIEKHLSFSLQFSSITAEQLDTLKKHPNLPKHIKSYIQEFDTNLSDEELKSNNYEYRVYIKPKTANKERQANEALENYVPVFKDIEKEKYLPKRIVKIMKDKEVGCPNFKIHDHTKLWQEKNAQDPKKGYGVRVEDQWYWYKNWVNVVKDHCKKNKAKYQ